MIEASVGRTAACAVLGHPGDIMAGVQLRDGAILPWRDDEVWHDRRVDGWMDDIRARLTTAEPCILLTRADLDELRWR